MAAKNLVIESVSYWTCGRCGEGNAPGRTACRCGNQVVDLPAAVPAEPKREGSRKLRKHREPNQTEADYGILLAAMKAKGDIVHYGFEEITLRWADQEYTPDYFVIVRNPTTTVLNSEKPDVQICGFECEVRQLIEVVFIELKGGHKWQRNVNTFKTFRERTPWARFEMWQRPSRSHGWEQLA